jgi:hypothetical protein
VRDEPAPITLLCDAAKHPPHGSIRVRSDRERADAGLPELGEGRAVGEDLARREA